MKVIFRRTLEESLRIPAIIISILAGVLAGVALGRTANYNTIPAFSYYMNALLIRQHMAVFFLINGVVLMTMISAISSGLIAGEVHEGTLRILITKPNSRSTILVSKILGMLTGTAILSLLALTIMYIIEIFMGKLDGNLVSGLLSYAPAYLLYGTIVTLFFSSLGVLLSCIAKRKVVALLPLLAIMIVTLGLPIVFRIVMEFASVEMSPILSLVDLNYHFSSIFRWCCDLCGGIHGTAGQLESLAMLTNMFEARRMDPDVVRGPASAIMKENNSLPIMGILAVYGLLICINYLSSFIIIRKKDV
ncbi:MAG: ABC transporter permease subunit [Erysipelotrichaceae bacterium]|nr:ABC transporter permease subunit [Erysipelotrichaceae bacterium]